MTKLIFLIAMFVQSVAGAETKLIQDFRRTIYLRDTPPCVMAAVPESRVFPPMVSPLVYCFWDQRVNERSICRLSGYNLTDDVFTSELPNGEGELRAERSCYDGGFSDLLNQGARGETVRIMVQRDARMYFAGDRTFYDTYLLSQSADIEGRPYRFPLRIPAPPAPPPPPSSAQKPKEAYTVVKVFFATDRKAGDPKISLANAFTNDRGAEDLTFGTIDVSIPFKHQLAQIEEPSIFKLEFSENPDEHIVIRSVDMQDLNAFQTGVRLRVASSPEKNAFVFIHGYNNPFSDAVKRTAQLAYDLNFNGAPILYTWPSGDGIWKYSVAEANAEWTMRHLQSFLESLPKMTGAKQIHLIAHSMGNRVLVNALTQIMAKSQSKLFRQIILAAPDVDTAVFGQIAEQIRKSAERVTIYSSENDWALKVSKKFHSYIRLGQGGGDVYTTAYSDTIDTTPLPTDTLGHSYFGDSDVVLQDIAKLISKALPPDKRPPLVSQPFRPAAFWQFMVQSK